MQKNRSKTAVFYLLTLKVCPKQDLNLHGLTATTPSK